MGSFNNGKPPFVLVGSALQEFGDRTGRTFATAAAIQATEILVWVHRQSELLRNGKKEGDGVKKMEGHELALQSYKLIYAS